MRALLIPSGQLLGLRDDLLASREPLLSKSLVRLVLLSRDALNAAFDLGEQSAKGTDVPTQAPSSSSLRSAIRLARSDFAPSAWVATRAPRSRARL
ncbi:hypothetical protein [Nesterenkonia pannonica]|uniref:hypothetical protein n=1 Tax=Nesterenkonia pannonica TaxID=1548602 RepID=UPI0021641B78|nr:hypothetical protein [Nesterenkonia pannonica]